MYKLYGNKGRQLVIKQELSIVFGTLLNKYKPDNNPAYWWPNNNERDTERIKVLRLMLEDLNQIEVTL